MCWNKGRLCWKIAKLFYFCHVKKFVRPETFGPYYVFLAVHRRSNITVTDGKSTSIFNEISASYYAVEGKEENGISFTAQWRYSVRLWQYSAHMWRCSVHTWHKLLTYDLVHAFIGFVCTAVEHSVVYTFGYLDNLSGTERVFGTFGIWSKPFLSVLFKYVRNQKIT